MTYDRSVLARWLVVVGTLAGCDRFLELDQVENPPHCPVPALSPGHDYDGDGELDEVDPCPFVPHESMHDEDGDGVPDDCDLCPQLAIDGEDLDCDGIGAACDPNDALPNTRQFFAFDHDPGSLSLDQATITGDHIHLQTSNTFAAIFVAPPGDSDGYYETSCTVTNFEVSSYSELELRHYIDDNTNGATGIKWETGELAIYTKAGMSTPVGSGAIAKIKMQATVTGSTAHFIVSGDVSGDISGPIDNLPAASMYGITLYDPQMNASADCDYLERIY